MQYRLGVMFFCLALGTCLSAQNGVGFPPVPAGPYELVSSGTQILQTPAERAAGLNLLNQAGQDYTFDQQGRPDTTIAVSLQSSGPGSIEGSGTMQDIWAGGRRTWAASFANTESGTPYPVASHPVPLRVVMARQALLWPIAGNLRLRQIRVANASFQGKPLTCVLVTQARVVAPAAGRSWRETEQCMDSQGLLRLMSPAPGLAYVYDYSSPLQFAGHTIASLITAYVAGAAVLQIQVTRLGTPSADDLATLAAQPPRPAILTGPIVWNFHPQAGQVTQVVVIHALFGTDRKLLASELLAGDPGLEEAALARLGGIRLARMQRDSDVYARIEFAGGQ